MSHEARATELRGRQLGMFSTCTTTRDWEHRVSAWGQIYTSRVESGSPPDFFVLGIRVIRGSEEVLGRMAEQTPHGGPIYAI